MELELAAETNERFNIKTGRGGLVDVEFLVQMLQLRYGHRLPAVRHRDTLSTLDALRACRVLSREESQVLKRGYQFLRRLENRLRIERDQPVEALERNAEQLTSLARRMGYEGAEAGARVLAEYHRQREAIRACYSRLFEREQGDSHEGPVGTITS
jgi:glutamate-ammonia-ligase adenylyltransferase